MKAENNKMFQFTYFDSCECLVYFLDYYHKRTKPDSADEYGNPTWNTPHYTDIGEILHDYKYNKKTDKISALYGIFFNEFYNKNADGQSIDLIIPVPSNSDTLHISEVAKYISNKLNIPYADILKKNTSVQQKNLTDSTRKNRNNFIFTDKTALGYGSILLIDDVVKTGTTIKECISTLKSLNPEVKITAFAFCSGMP